MISGQRGGGAREGLSWRGLVLVAALVWFLAINLGYYWLLFERYLAEVPALLEIGGGP